MGLLAAELVLAPTGLVQYNNKKAVGAQMIRVLYLQLPVLDFGYDYAGGDHPLAGGYLAASALAKGVAHEPIFLPQSLSSFASNQALVKEILSLDPQVVVATLHLWNVERTLRLGRALRESNPDIRLLAGGPEVAGDFGLRFPEHPFDWVHSGEGEAVFPRVLEEISRDLKAGPRRLVEVAREASAPICLEELPSPYLLGLLPKAPDGSIWVETMRGCPFRCVYCFYGKNFKELRWFPSEWLRQHVLWAADKEVKEIYLLDPSFQVTPALPKRLEELALWNALSVPLHTEARVDHMNPDLAQGFKKAGFHSVETGLQSIHPRVLRKAGRFANPRAFAKGAHLILEKGIRLQIDVILGLPGDSPEGFLKTIDFLGEQALGQYVTVFPLLVLPGTRLQEKASSWQVHYRASPPYQIEAVGGTHKEQFRRALEEAEKRLDLGLYPLHLPDLSPQQGLCDLIGLVEIHDQTRGNPPGLSLRHMENLAQCPVFLFKSQGEEPPWGLMARWAAWQKRFMPELLCFWGLEAKKRFFLGALEKLLKQLHDPGSYQAGLWSLCPDDYLRLSCRPFVLSTCREDPGFWLEVNQLLPVIRIVQELPFPLEDGALGRLPVLWETQRLLPLRTLKALRPVFQGREEELLFSRRENVLSWARITGLPLPPGRPRMGRIRLP